jgi:hypothetical protein
MKRFIQTIIVSSLGALALSTFSQIPFIAWAGVVYTVLLVKDLLDSLGKKLPFGELVMAIMGVQLLVSPFMEYYVFQLKIVGGMSVPDLVYYGYALPCTILLHFGLVLFYPQNNLESRLFEILSSQPGRIEKKGLLLIGIGYLGYFLVKLNPSVSVDFIIQLLSFSRLIGFLYLWLAGSKYTPFAFLFVIVPFTIEAINDTILINVIVYFTVLASIYYMKHKTARWKIYFFFIVAAFILITVQSVKSNVRNIVGSERFEGSRTLLFTQKIYDQISELGAWDLKRVGGAVNVRVNQGFILGDILDNFKHRKDQIKPDYFFKEFIGVVMPRFIYRDKPVVGDKEKFRQFVGWRLGRKVSMTVGLMGDGYGNFGKFGGMLYCLGFGMILGLIFKIWNHVGHSYPTVLIWGILIFYYCMRAGDETYMIINWILKSSVFVFFYFLFFERTNTMDRFLPKTSYQSA